MKEKDIEEIKELTALRTNYFSMIMLVSGGVATLLLANLPMQRLIVLFAAGLYFDSVFILKFMATDEKIKTILRRE